MSFFNKMFKKKEPEVVKVVIPPTPEKQEIKMDLPEGTIVDFPEGILNTNSPQNMAIFKHNLNVLMQKAKEEGRLDKFFLIREDDYFPIDYKWRVASYSTSLEQYILGLSYAIKKKYALEKSGINNTFNGIELPVEPSKMNEALSKVDPKTGFVYQPSHFRSTKHFTINTPLGVTGSYNSVKTERNFTIIDSIDNFLKSGYGYSIAYFDAYLDVSHEGLDISEKAIIMIEKSKYDVLSQNPVLASKLSQRKVVVYVGDENLAINMVLTSQGALPSQIGSLYAQYDDRLKGIIETSIIDLASQNNLLFDQSHSAYIHPENGHFSNHFDDLNTDHYRYIDEFIEFMKAKFPEQSSLFTPSTINNSEYSSKIIEIIGTEALLKAINEYNEQTLTRFNERYASYVQDHDNISEEDKNAIMQTLQLIKENYSINLELPDAEQKALLEEAIRRFFQLPKTADQLEAAKIVWNILGPIVEQNKTQKEESLAK